ncbi:MAG TPA: hypothetical protein VFG58_09740 [Solirubrobacterales bacterium]|nr:hypothetical protein [Solirubrobacterales bacterium]
MVDRYRSKPLELPPPEHEFDRADLAFYDLDHSGATFEARVFVGAPRNLGRNADVDHPAYAGSLYVFGHGDCHGEKGHCAVPAERDPFDYRLPHHLEPGVQVVTVTAAVKRLVEAGKSKAPVDVIVHGPEGEAPKALDFSHIRLLTYA